MHGSTASVVWTCVGLYWDRFRAEWSGDQAAIDKASQELVLGA